MDIESAKWDPEHGVIDLTYDCGRQSWCTVAEAEDAIAKLTAALKQMARKKEKACPVRTYDLINMGNEWEPSREMVESQHGEWVKWADIAPYVSAGAAEERKEG